MQKPMRLTSSLITMAAAVAMAITPLTALADSSEPWEFEGGGWGHGVGLSQYGSQGMAVEGYSVEEIIDHYYSGANVKKLSSVGAPSWLTEPEAVWVGLSAGQTGRSFKAIGGEIEVCQTGDGSDSCASPDVVLNNGQVLVIQVVGTSPLRCTRSIDGSPATEGDCWFDIPLGASTSNGIEQGGMKLVRGTLHIRPNSPEDDPYAGGGTRFHTSVSVDLRHYIYGIAETILSWKPAALETQAVIARSYGVRKALDRATSTGELTDARKASCWCHLSSSPGIDQNYDGWDVDNEGSSTYGQRWRDAVDATAAEIVTHPQVGGGNEIISTFYSSSNGGASENNEDVWPGSPVPYLRSVADRWSADPNINPLASWTVYVSDVNMASYFGWDYVLDATVVKGPPGVVVEFIGKDNGSDVSMTLNGTQVRSLLNTYGYVSSGSVRVSPYITDVIDPPGFDDIKGHTFENAIEWLRTQEITVGCTETEFCPDRTVTRGEMAVFISRADNLPAPSGDYFKDDNGKFYEGGANRLYEAGITTGCGGGNFCGGNDLPRKQMAVFMVRALDLPPTNVDYFHDDDGSSYEDAINSLAAARITVGCNPPDYDRFCPDGTVTRGQMAAFFKRAWGP